MVFHYKFTTVQKAKLDDWASLIFLTTIDLCLFASTKKPMSKNFLDDISDCWITSHPFFFLIFALVRYVVELISGDATPKEGAIYPQVHETQKDIMFDSNLSNGKEIFEEDLCKGN